MMFSKYTEVQRTAALEQLDAGRPIEEIARELGVSKATIYEWKAKYRAKSIREARLREEDARVQKMVLELIAAGDRENCS